MGSDGIIAVFQVFLIVLRLNGIIDWSWPIVFVPAIAYLTPTLIYIMILVLFEGVDAFRHFFSG
jgi:hypothetical protein